MRRLIGFLRGLMVPALALLALAFVPPGTASAATVSSHQEVRSCATPTIGPSAAPRVAVNMRSTVGGYTFIAHPVDYGVSVQTRANKTMRFTDATDDFNTSAATLTGRAAAITSFSTPAPSRRANMIFYARRVDLRRI